ncbi:hypothetical protein BN982_03239 [Halobacillus karajensis]|uniref:Uncharacterized protein n=1 Tax=Halobacillus karajensis TaxID=195088 RepID=A0A024P4T9_9BACI|nr:hypothetical protein BN982_03239 [Halobacillus karajensis]CDQ23646.1 hypothetical protein BN983_01897 [Halobacillus karajensis]CDQ27124.1 hypothetical protein BN981_01378 [Halobacillus karajensis]
MNANCPKCQQQTTFVSNDNKKNRCQKCNSIMNKCINGDCINMISFGLYCSKCVGSGLKKTGVGAATVGAVVVGTLARVYLGNKGKS